MENCCPISEDKGDMRVFFTKRRRFCIEQVRVLIRRKATDVYRLKWATETVAVLSRYEEESGRASGFHKNP